MKRKVLSIVACVALMATAATAQETGFGAKLGMNLANMSGDVEDASNRTSLNIGGFYNMMISDAFGLQFELVYSGQGYKMKETTVTEPSGIPGVPDITYTMPEATYKMDYINIPILAKYYFTESLNVVAGPQIGFNIGAKVDVDGESEDLEDVSSLDIALGFGLQYELEMGLGFGARYNVGMSNTYSGEGDYTAKNNVIQIGLQYQF